MIDALKDPPPLKPPPPNSCTLSVWPGIERVHTLLRLTYNITHLSEDAQKLLVFSLTEALTELEKGIQKMGKIEVAKKVAQRERIKEFQGNNNGDPTKQ